MPQITIKLIAFFFRISILFFGATTMLPAQQIIEGALLSKQGEPIIGASVLVRGTTLGTVTDLSGQFSLEVSESISNPVLIISYTGFNTEEVAASAFRQIDLGDMQMTVSLALRKLCADGFEIQYPKRYQWLLVPWEGAKQRLLDDIQKKKLKKDYEEELSAGYELIKLRLGRLWYCFENNDFCEPEVRLDYANMKSALTSYSDLFKELRQAISAGKDPKDGIPLLRAFREELAAVDSHQCDGN